MAIPIVVDLQIMQMRCFTMVTSNNWVDLTVAAEYAGVRVGTVVDAITDREIRAVTSHPDRPGDWMVPLADIDQWWRRRQARAIIG
jgi:hypothetical protein